MFIRYSLFCVRISFRLRLLSRRSNLSHNACLWRLCKIIQCVLYPIYERLVRVFALFINRSLSLQFCQVGYAMIVCQFILAPVSYRFFPIENFLFQNNAPKIVVRRIFLIAKIK